jgi:hypothetical protein
MASTGTLLAISWRNATGERRTPVMGRRNSDAFDHEVLMSGRRSHPRFAVATPWDGAVRILRDVVVNRTADDELLAISNTAAVVGEMQTLELMGGGYTAMVRVRVLDSRPIIIDGTVRHRIRLGLVEMQQEPVLTEAAVPAGEPVSTNVQRVAEVG